MNLRYVLSAIFFFVFANQFVSGQDKVVFQLDGTKKGNPIHSTMYGLFFEDINFAADGGLYAELVKNRSFDFPQSLMGWKVFGNVDVLNSNSPFINNPNYLKLSSSGHPHKHTGIENEGFRGIGFKKGETYLFSVWAKNESQGESKLRINLIDSNNNIIGSHDLQITSSDWAKYEISITAKETDKNGKLRLFLVGNNAVSIEHVSLFPTDTWKGRKYGLRKDLAQALSDLNPGIFRFPGGCIVEGTEIEDRYDWKKSIGVVENRPLNSNRWEYTFTNRFFPDYYQSYGLGFYEYFLLSEDIGAEPLPIVNVGLVCQYQNTGEHCHVPVGDLDSFIQDALDLIEFANGDVSTKWGKIRADLGHPKPFDLKFIGVGNEQWGHEYVERLALFVKAIRKAYPKMKIVGSSGPSADGKEFDYLWPEMKSLNIDLVDEHYYKDPQWFLKNANRYDTYDRTGPAVFAGEYACHMPDRANSFESALSEAAFMTGLERNADIVHMATYAPLLAHVDAWQWRPDMIWFDNLSVVKTPNYYVQQLFANHTGTNTASLTYGGQAITGQDGLYASAVYDVEKGSYIIKVVNVSAQDKEIDINISGLKKNQILNVGETIILHSELQNSNSFDTPGKVFPQEGSFTIKNNVASLVIEGHAFGVYQIRVK